MMGLPSLEALMLYCGFVPQGMATRPDENWTDRRALRDDRVRSSLSDFVVRDGAVQRRVVGRDVICVCQPCVIETCTTGVIF